MDNFKYIDVFVCLAQTKSFSATAKHFGCSVSTISKQLIYLEQSINAKLVNRTTRAVSLTPAGETYFSICRDSLKKLKRIEDELGSPDCRSIPEVLRAQFVCSPQPQIEMQLMAGFLKQNPSIVIEALYTDNFLDMDIYDIDVSVVTGEVTSQVYSVQKIASSEYMLCVSPDFLEAYGRPSSPEDLKNFSCLHLNDNKWCLRKDDQKVEVDISGQFFSSEHSAILRACLNGLGVACISPSVGMDYIEKGQLIHILEEWKIDKNHYIVFKEGDYLPQKIKLFKYYLADLLNISPDVDIEEANLCSNVQEIHTRNILSNVVETLDHGNDGAI